MNGLYQDKPQLPFTLGAECAGVITSLANDVNETEDVYIGAWVMGFCANLGAWATYVDVALWSVFPIPSAFGRATSAFCRAATVPVVFGTAWLAWDLCGVREIAIRTHDHKGICENIAVLVTGASGGAGSAAVILAKALGITVIACARGNNKLLFCKDVLLADHVLDVSGNSVADLSKRVRLLVPEGVHAAFDAVGGPIFDECVRATRWGGRVAIVGFASGQIPNIRANILLVKGVSVVGIYFGADLQRRKTESRKLFCQMLDLLAENDLYIPVTETIPLREADRAIDMLSRGDVMGKVVLTVSESWPTMKNVVGSSNLKLIGSAQLCQNFSEPSTRQPRPRL